MPEQAIAYQSVIFVLESRSSIPQDIALYNVPVLIPGGDGNSISRLAKVGESVGADFKFGLIDRSVSVSWAFNHPELGAICSVRAMYIEWQGDWLSA